MAVWLEDALKIWLNYTTTNRRKEDSSHGVQLYSVLDVRIVKSVRDSQRRWMISDKRDI